MNFFAVTGRPILHSKSPLIFNSYFRSHSLSSHYTRLAADSAREAIALFHGIGLRGMNVTSPFKMEIIPHLQMLNPVAEKIGAVNAVIRKGHVLKGYNNDHQGVRGALGSEGIRLRGKKCLVIGAGGAGRSAVYALKNKGARVTLLNRDLKKARQVGRIMGCEVGSLKQLKRYIADSQVIVAAVPFAALSLDVCDFRPDQVFLNADYRDQGFGPLAEEKGLRYIRGEKWLKHQAIPALKLFLGKEISLERMDWGRVLQAGSPAWPDNIALIGFMGSGKSTIGQGLAARMGYDFLDTDEWIEKQIGQSVRDIFHTRGEAYFRKKEKETIARFTSKKQLVMACGGGAILDRENRTLLAGRSLVVWLYTSLETALSRMEISLRPLFEHQEPAAHAHELFRRRLRFYFQCADLVVNNERQSDRTVRKIHEEIRLAF